MVLDAPNALGHCSGAVRERLLGGPGTLLDVSRLLSARLGRLKIGLWAAFGRPPAVPNTSGRIPETALSAQNGPRSIFRQFLLDFAKKIIDFGFIFRRFFVCCWDIWALCLLLLSASFLCSCALLTFARSLSTIDRLNGKRKKNAQVPRPSCAWLLELAHTTFIILSATCEPTLYTFDQASST